jgi:hypothetical protein
MDGGGLRRRNASVIQIAIAASLAVHCAILGLLVSRAPQFSHPQFDDRSVPMEPANPFQRARPLAPPAESRRTRHRLPGGPAVMAPLAASPRTAETGATAPPALPSLKPSEQPTGDARLSSALRRSGIGCANADSVALSDAEREACRHRLAEGAPQAPFISGVPPEKSQYYAALQQSEAEMNRNPEGGHLPGIVCGGAKKRLGLKLGPCVLAAPLSPWIPEADVQRP